MGVLQGFMGVLQGSMGVLQGLSGTCSLRSSCCFFHTFVFTKVAFSHLRPQLLQQTLQNQVYQGGRDALLFETGFYPGFDNHL